MDKLFTSENIKNAGLVGILAFILFTGFNENWVWGNTYREVKAERDEWKRVALEGLQVAKEISPARLPILTPPSVNSQEPFDVEGQLETIKNINKAH